MKPALLDARVHAWWHTAGSAGCVLQVRPSVESSSSSESASATCANVDVLVRVYCGDLRAASAKLGEFLRLLHAATARPMRLQRYDWLQQLLWPNVCTLVECSCCHHGDRHLTIRILSPRSQLTPQPQVLTDSLFDWDEANASVEYHELLTAIREGARVAHPEAPLSLVVAVLPPLSRVVNTDNYLADMKVLIGRLSKTTSDWFQVESFSASLAQGLTYAFHRKQFKMLLASKLPLALPAFSPYKHPCDSRMTMHKWLFRHRAPKESPPLTMPVITELCMRSIGCPSVPVFTEFCAWLATNDSLKVFVIAMPSHLSSSSPKMWEDFGFALFSPCSKFSPRRLEVDIRGLSDSNIDAMASGSERLSLNNQPNASLPHRSQGKLKLKCSGVPTATVITFLRHFGHAIHELETKVDEVDYSLLLQTILRCSPQLAVLRISIYGASPQHLTTTEGNAGPSTFTTPKLHSLTIVDNTETRASQVASHILGVMGQALTHLCIEDHRATSAIAGTILRSCPVLDALAVNRAEASFWDQLSEGYSSGACKVSNLTIGETASIPSPWMFELVQSLSNPQSPFTKALKKFRNVAYNLRPPSEVQGKLLEMLDVNPFLVQLVLPFDLDDSMRAKHGEIVANRANRLRPRQRFALLSCSPSIANGSVPREIWRLILDFSAQPVRRSVTTRSPLSE